MNGGRIFAIINGILGALISGILILGAAIRNAGPIIAWIVFAIIRCIIVAIFIIAAIVALAVHEDDGPDSKLKDLVIGVVVFWIIAGIAEIIYKIWAIFVAFKAIGEIRRGE